MDKMADELEQSDDEENKVGKVKLANLDLAIVIHQLQKKVSVLEKKNLEQLEELEKMKNGRVEFELEVKRKYRNLEQSENQEEIDELKEQIKTTTFLLNTITKEKTELRDKLALSHSSTISTTIPDSDDSARSEVELELKLTKFKLERKSDEVDYLKDQLKSESENITALRDEVAKIKVELEVQGSQMEIVKKKGELEKEELQTSMNGWKQLEMEYIEKIGMLESQVQNAIVKESFNNNLLNDRDEEVRNLKEELRKALEDKKSYQDSFMGKHLLVTSLRKELTQTNEKLKKKGEITNGTYKKEKSIWESTLRTKEVQILHLQGENEKLRAFADKLKKLSQFEVDDFSSSILNELDKLEDHISKKAAAVEEELLKVERDKCDNSTTLKDELAKMEEKLNLQRSQLERANKRVAQVESEKQRLQKSLHEQQKLEAEYYQKIISLEGEVRNAAVKESFHMNLLDDWEKENRKLKEDLKKALDDKKSYQDDCSKHVALMTSMQSELTQAKQQLEEQQENVRIVNACINEIEVNYKQETSTWESTLRLKTATIVDLKWELEKLLAFANKLKKLSHFKMSISSSSIVNELDKLVDHISQKMMVALVKEEEKTVPETRKAPETKRELMKVGASTTNNPSQNEISVKNESHKKPKGPLDETPNDLIDTKKVDHAGPRFSNTEARKPNQKTPAVLTPLSGITVIIPMDTDDEIDVVTID